MLPRYDLADKKCRVRCVAAEVASTAPPSLPVRTPMFPASCGRYYKRVRLHLIFPEPYFARESFSLPAVFALTMESPRFPLAGGGVGGSLVCGAAVHFRKRAFFLNFVEPSGSSGECSGTNYLLKGAMQSISTFYRPRQVPDTRPPSQTRAVCVRLEYN